MFPPWPSTQPIPKTCTVTDVCRILQISRATFDRRHREWGLVETPQIGRGRRFTGESVERLAGSRWQQPVHAD